MSELFGDMIDDESGYLVAISIAMHLDTTS